MNNDEAHSLLVAELGRYRTQTYEALRRLLNAQDAFEVTASSGTKYQVEVQAFWDHKQGGNLRVMGSIDDGGWHAFKPLCSDFIISPTGEFVGE